MFGRRSRLPIASRFNVILISLKFPTPGHLAEQDYDASSLFLTNPTFNSSRSSFVWLVACCFGTVSVFVLPRVKQLALYQCVRIVALFRIALHNTPQRESVIEKISRGLMWPVRGFSNRLRVVCKSAVLCISVRVEESPVDRHFCFLLFTSTSWRSQPYVRSQKLRSILLI